MTAAERAAEAINAWMRQQYGLCETNERIAAIIAREYAELEQAVEEFVQYYAGHKQGQLGNGQAYKSCSRLRSALAKVRGA